MGKIYTIAIVSKVAQRDAKLGSLLSDSDDLDIPFEFILSKNGKIQKEIGFNIKTYKTLNGATRESVKINRKYSGKSIRLNKGYYFDKKTFTFDTSLYVFFVIDITEKWNKYIDEEVLKVTAEYNRVVQKLNYLKV
jgi:hypothetical protein